MQKKCLGLFGFIFGHKFEPRYTVTNMESNMHHAMPPVDQIADLAEALDNIEQDELLDKLEMMIRNGNDATEQQYVCEVCIRCGEVIRV